MRLAAALIALTLPAPAYALSCAFGPTDSLPADGAVDVPTNVVLRVMVIGSDTEEATLTDDDGNAVEVQIDVHQQGSTRLLSITPAEPLDADAAYTLVAGSEQDFTWTASFRTAAGPDTDAPARPIIDDASRDRSRSEWGRTDHLIVDLDAAAEPVMYRVDVFPDGQNSVHQVYVLPWEQDPGLQTISVGEGLCATSIELEGAVDFEVTAIDLAGNASDPTEQGTVSGGCSSVAAPAGLGVLGLSLGLIALRRRRGASPDVDAA